MISNSLFRLGKDRLDKLPLDKLRNLVLERLELSRANKFSISAAVLATGFAYYVAKLIIYKLYFHPLASLPGPSVDWIPFLGNFREVVHDDVCGPHKKWAKQYGPIVRSYGLFNEPRVILNDPALIKQVLTIQQYNFPKTRQNASFLANVLGHGLLVAEGDVHKRQRKLLNPAFSVQSTKNIAPFVYDPMFDLFEHWDGILAGSNEPHAMDVSGWMSHVTLDVIGLAAFGERFNTVKYEGDDDKVNRLSQAYTTIFDANSPVLLGVLEFLIPPIRNIPTERNRRYNQALRWVREESQALVYRGIERVKSGNHKDERSLLSLMVNFTDDRTGKGMTPEELREQCMTFLAAGHETTAVSMSWCLWLLAQNQDIQDQLRAEVTPVFKDVDPADKSTYPDFDAVDQLHLLNNVCKENSRLIPVVSLIARQSIKETTLSDYVIPKDTVVIVPITAIHHDPKIWGEDAEVFRPDRWDEEPASKISPYEYLPFLAGGRQCIGFRFALIELKIMLGLLLTKYQFFEKPGFTVNMKSEITLKPTPNMTLLVTPVSP